MSDFEKLRFFLAKNGYKMTAVRKNVYAALVSASQPLSNVELIRSLPDLDRVSVYRTITLFENIGIAHRIWNGFKSSIELSEEFSPHHHHFTCTNCGRVVSFKSDEVERALDTLSTSLNATIDQHLIELRGYCENCRS